MARPPRRDFSANTAIVIVAGSNAAVRRGIPSSTIVGVRWFVRSPISIYICNTILVMRSIFGVLILAGMITLISSLVLLFSFMEPLMLIIPFVTIPFLPLLKLIVVLFSIACRVSLAMGPLPKFLVLVVAALFWLSANFFSSRCHCWLC